MLGIAGGCVPAGKLRGDDLRQGQVEELTQKGRRGRVPGRRLLVGRHPGREGGA